MDDSTPKRDNHTPSCVVCQRRKVRCTRVFPCAACTKSGLECHFPVPGTHGKRKRRSISTTQHPTIHNTGSQPRNTSDLVSDRSSAVKAATDEFPSPESTGSQSGATTARLVSEGSGYRYVNNHLWTAISADGQIDHAKAEASPDGRRPSLTASRTDPTTFEDVSKSGEELHASRSFVFGNGSPDPDTLVAAIQVPASHIVYMWQTYQANVDPVMKISHVPSAQGILLGQIGRRALPRNEHALTAAVYFISVVSLTDDQCQESMGQSRASLMKTYRDATEIALSSAGFITTTDIMVLQALVLYLAALRSTGEIQGVWSLLGIAIRIAGTIGLARDGSSFGLSPFETEMRRRLWWGIVYFDGRMAELVGQDGDLMGNNFDAGSPSNLNDNDLFPTMTRLPEARRTPTDAVYLQARVLSMTVARSLQSVTGPQGTWHRLHDATMSTSEKLDIIQRIERRYNEEVLEVCDPTVPLQWLSINTARTFATKLRLIARIPIVDTESEWEDANGFSENAFLLSMDLLQIQLDLWCEPSVQQWKWHWQAHFQWYALVTLLRQTRLRQTGQGASRAWSLIKKVFDIIIPSLALGPKKNLLLDGIHSLLNAAKRQQDQPLDGDGGMSIDNGDQKHTSYHEGENDVMSPPDLKSPNGIAYSHGSRPHAALLPGMDNVGQQVLPTGSFVGRSGMDDAVLGFDLDAIDWVEFDRLATELCQQ